jgi:hypothetical protein
MLEIFFFSLGIVNSILLIAIFVIRRKRLIIILRYGWLYLLLAIPAIFGIFLAAWESKPVQYSIFLGIFLAFLLLEGLLDHVFKVDFRENIRKYWMWMVPYLLLYYAMNYGFIIMPWKTSLAWGLISLGLILIQLIANLGSHPKMKQPT